LQYLTLNALTEKYAGRPFRILGFPCNQFGKQEPGANSTEIYNALKYVRPGNGFVPNFDLFEKSEINGADEIPVYTFLKSRCDATRQTFKPAKFLFHEPLHVADVRWNFEKFLLDHEGNPVYRYDEKVDPLEISPDIDNLLQKMSPAEVRGPPGVGPPGVGPQVAPAPAIRIRGPLGGTSVVPARSRDQTPASTRRIVPISRLQYYGLG